MKHSWKTILSLLLAAAMLFALACTGFAASTEGEEGSDPVSVTWEKIDASPRGIGSPAFELADEDPYGPDDVVRVSIVMEETPAIRAGFSKYNIGSNAGVQSYRDSLRAAQDVVAERISNEVLDGQKLDVVWNMTLAANLISANVPYKTIEDIKAVSGVKDVVIEMQYYPSESVNMSNASQMVGSTQVWSSGYTGAGSIVAIIDTGIDTAHELFAEDAFEYAIEQTGKTVDLLTAAELSSKWRSLNASRFGGDVTATRAYVSSKIPFAVNYVDRDLDVTHVNDNQGEHGSHVAGIAAANRFIKAGGEYVPALEEVLTQGEAPDAQILVMKVFGKGGGAYDSDYMIAIEDAIVLGADAVNLSLGSAVAGYVTSDYYQDVMEGLAETNTVVAMSAGNSYEWPYFAAIPYLYSDGVTFDTVGSPGSFTNSLAVASVDNDGVTGKYISAYDNVIFYAETFSDKGEYNNAPIDTVAGEHEFVYIDSTGCVSDDAGNILSDDFAALGSSYFEGKIAICNRGASSFFEKANAAVEQGAIAVIVANNQPGVINMNLAGYKYEAPAVSITQADGNMLKANAEMTTVDGIDVYTGNLTVETDVYNTNYGEHYYTMSDFSSWGVPGDLSLKPEITAPGGNIWSVNGMNHGYENMSGTSMASPQIAGVTALVAQYIRENDFQTTLTPRQLITSLLMSTAVPLKEKDSGSYYSVLKQGAGLVDADAAVSSKTYITMNEDATASYADGKVKVELGDDPARRGVYSFSFNINNLSDEALPYDVRGDFFTQDLFSTDYGILQDTWTAPLDAEIVWTADGEVVDPEGGIDLDFNGDEIYDDEDAKALLEYVVNGTEPESLEGADFDGDGEITTYDAYLALSYIGGVSITIPANGSVTIGVTVTLNDIANYDDSGAYIEGYIFATGRADAEGVLGTEHSIPVIGYYGGWNEPSMHDVGSRLEFAYETEDRYPYMYAALGDKAFEVEGYGVRYGWSSDSFALGGNPVALDEEFMPERESIAPDSVLTGVNYSLVRNSAGGLFLVYADDEMYDYMFNDGQYAAYYDANDGRWDYTSYGMRIGEPLDGLEEDTFVEFIYVMAPEYYLDSDGEVDWDEVGFDDAIYWGGVIDGSAPEIIEIAPVLNEAEDTVEAVSISAEENRYVAGVLIWNEEGWASGGEPILVIPADPEAKEGDDLELEIPNGEGGIDFSLEENKHLMVQIYDYAANYASYKLNLDLGQVQAGPTSLNVDPAESRILPGDTILLTVSAEPWGADESCTWESLNPRIATVDENGVVTGVSEGKAVIRATSTVNPEATGEAVVTVYYPDIDIDAALCDEDGAFHYITFNTAAMLRGEDKYYKTLADSRNDILDMAWSLDGETIYLSDSSGTLYTLNPRDFSTRLIGADSQFMHLGMAPSIAFQAATGVESVDLASIYNFSDAMALFAVDTSSGEFYYDQGYWYLNLNDWDFIAGDNLVGIAHIQSEDIENAGLAFYDDYIIIDDLSNVYFFELMYTKVALGDLAPGLYVDYQRMGTFGASVSTTWYWNSLYFDEESGNLFWSRLDNSLPSNKRDAQIHMAPVIFGGDYPALGKASYVGTFDRGVWPVLGLIDFEKNSKDAVGTGRTLDGVAAKASDYTAVKLSSDIETLNRINGFEGKSDVDSKTLAGGLNSVSVTSAGTRSIEVVTPPPAADYYVVITPDQTNHNGLITVTYDPEEVELLDAFSEVEEYNVIKVDEEKGEVTIGYATRDMVYEGYTEVLVLAFKMLEEVESVVSYTVEQVDDDFKAKEPVEDIIGTYGYNGPEWIIADDYRSATAVFTRVDDETITEEVEAEVTTETVPAPSPFIGKTIYTYTVEFRGETYTTQVVVMIPPTPEPPAPPTPSGDEPGDDEPGDDEPGDDFPFVDVDEDDWFYSDVYEMYKAGYIKGTSETTYEPDEEITRGQIVTILFRIDGENKVDGGVTFEDVKPGAFYYDAVAWASANGIVNGYSASEFAPDDDISREQFAAIVYRYAKFKGHGFTGAWYFQLDFEDAADVSEWADEAMHWCVMNKLINGYDGKLDPQGTANRAQAAAIFNRMTKLFE
ncbi:MAG: S8 family serine peptidase [Oscillospiraceae bacterium]|nr:S8 family serine peptidase [Oscillospiraceae bacterium]